MDFFKQFDTYTLQARLYPALLILMPALATILAWYPSLLTSNAGAAILTVINTCGLMMLLGELSRSQGQRIQMVLLKKWGVLPTTRILRHADRTLSKTVKGRYHSFLSGKLGKAFPTPDEEANAPAVADEIYGSGVFWLKEHCRGPSFPSCTARTSPTASAAICLV